MNSKVLLLLTDRQFHFYSDLFPQKLASGDTFICDSLLTFEKTVLNHHDYTCNGTLEISNLKFVRDKDVSGQSDSVLI